MGIEYQTNFINELTADQLSGILDELKDLSELITLQNDENNLLSFRFSDSPERYEWREDCTIEIEPSFCYVVFHTGSLAKHGQILAKITKIFERNKFQVTFDEL